MGLGLAVAITVAVTVAITVAVTVAITVRWGCGNLPSCPNVTTRMSGSIRGEESTVAARKEGRHGEDDELFGPYKTIHVRIR
jgi:hypothetical protein